MTFNLFLENIKVSVEQKDEMRSRTKTISVWLYEEVIVHLFCQLNNPELPRQSSSAGLYYICQAELNGSRCVSELGIVLGFNINIL